MEHRAILFLDIDGVLNHIGTHGIIDSDCLKELKRIIDETECEVVLSSSWKTDVKRENGRLSSDVKWLDTLIKELGIIDITPDIDEEHRELEVEEWLRGHKAAAFVVVDDIEFEFREKFPGNFVKTAGFNGKGFTRTHGDEAIRILKRDLLNRI